MSWIDGFLLGGILYILLVDRKGIRLHHIVLACVILLRLALRFQPDILSPIGIQREGLSWMYTVGVWTWIVLFLLAIIRRGPSSRAR